tara:strand:+ start:725 stop:955 length:231 start_codon:yes stop_codon:yes gene_type:complete
LAREGGVRTNGDTGAEFLCSSSSRGRFAPTAYPPIPPFNPSVIIAAHTEVRLGMSNHRQPWNDKKQKFVFGPIKKR